MRQFDSGRGLKMFKSAKLPLLLAIVLGLLWILSADKLYAQNFDFNKAYQDYQYSFTKYDQASTDFDNAKNSYLKNTTLKLKEDLRQKTIQMLKARDQLIKVYLTMLRMKVVENKGLTDEYKNNLFAKIDPEVEWYNLDSSKYLDSDSLELLFDKGDQPKNRYESSTILIINEAMAYVTIGEVTEARTNHEQIFTGIRSLIDAGVSSGKLTLTPFNNWFSDIDATDQTLKQNEGKARQKIAELYTQSYSPKSTFNSAVNILEPSVVLLSKFNQSLNEILNYIKNQQ